MTWKCAICSGDFDGIPDDAVRLTRSKARTNVFRFADDSIQALRKIRGPKSEMVPPPSAEPSKEATELLHSVVEVLAELPKPQSEPQPEVVEEGEEPTITTMAAAFRKFKS